MTRCPSTFPPSRSPRLLSCKTQVLHPSTSLKMPPSHTSQDSDGDSFDSLRFLCPNFEEVEDAEKYRLGGFHPVHLGDIYDDGRYRIVHKLGAGGFSTVWLARDEHNRSWVALKFVVAKHSPSISDKSHLSSQAASKLAQGPSFISEIGRFTFDGPNGHHLCLVLPVFGPSTSTLSTIFSCRLQPWLARKVGYQAAKAVADLHAQGICHGGMTSPRQYLKLPSIYLLPGLRYYNWEFCLDSVGFRSL